jgi:hypothetical protein
MPAEREDSKSLVDEKEVEEGRRRRSTGEDVRKKFRDTINEWRAPPANERKQSLFLPEREIKLSRSSFKTTEAFTD